MKRGVLLVLLCLRAACGLPAENTTVKNGSIIPSGLGQAAKDISDFLQEFSTNTTVDDDLIVEAPAASIGDAEILPEYEFEWNQTSETFLLRPRRAIWTNVGLAFLNRLSNIDVGKFLGQIKNLFGKSTPKALEQHGHDFDSASSDRLTYDILNTMINAQSITHEQKQEQILQNLSETESNEVHTLLVIAKSANSIESYLLIIVVLLGFFVFLFSLLFLFIICKALTARVDN